jgi:hypothetical protein
MNLRTRFKPLLRLMTLCMLLVSLGSLSTASADRNTASTTPSVAPASARVDASQAQSQEQRATTRCLDEQPAASLLALTPTEPTSSSAADASATTAATCPSGQAWTCCSCGCGCRKSTISPKNFCMFFFCP